MPTRKYGYMRVSSKDQNEHRQYLALIETGVPPQNIYLDKISGKDFDRPAYQKLVRERLQRGDLLVVKSIDRLGRNYNEILKEWGFVTKTVGAHIQVLDMPLLNTQDSHDLLDTFVVDLVLQLLSYVAENERNQIRTRQAEGIEAARSRGVHLGRPPRELPQNFEEICCRWKNKEISPREARILSGLPPDQFYRAVRRLNP